jgi:ribosomal protein S18 acetylase RimI-like enzyme
VSASGPAPLARIRPVEAHRVVSVLAEAFADYPVMRHVIGSAGEDYPRRLERLVGFFVMARALRDEPMLAIPDGADLAAAMTMSFPDRGPEPAGLGALRAEVWADLGAEARARYERCGEVWATLDVQDPHVHVNMIGVRRAFQGTGLARRLLDEAQAVSRTTPGSRGVSLTTEDPRNVELYRRVGYEVVGHARVTPDLESWGLFRRD